MQVDQGLDIPDAWCEQLARFKSNDPNAIIAGGSLRDLFILGSAAPKDIDIFTVSQQLPAGITISKSGMDYEGMKYVQAVGVYAIEGLPPINIIFLEQHSLSVSDFLATFDFGLCQIAFDGQKLIKTPAFDYDYKNSTFTMHHVDRYARSVRRYARWLDRYNYDISIPALSHKTMEPVF